MGSIFPAVSRTAPLPRFLHDGEAVRERVRIDVRYDSDDGGSASVVGIVMVVEDAPRSRSLVASRLKTLCEALVEVVPRVALVIDGIWPPRSMRTLRRALSKSRSRGSWKIFSARGEAERWIGRDSTKHTADSSRT